MPQCPQLAYKIKAKNLDVVVGQMWKNAMQCETGKGYTNARGAANHCRELGLTECRKSRSSIFNVSLLMTTPIFAGPQVIVGEPAVFGAVPNE